jgi:AcrR family transcriptional regulator
LSSSRKPSVRRHLPPPLLPELPSAQGCRARDRERHEDEILAAAERVFASRGFESATMAEVAAAAGFAVATLYNLCRSKEEILERLICRHMAALDVEVEAATARVKGVRRKIEATVLARVRYFGRNGDFFRLYASEVPGVARELGSKSSPRVVQAIAKRLAHLRDLFEALPRRRGAATGSGGGARAARKPLDSAMKALLFHAATRAYIVERVIRSKRTPTDAEVASIVAGLLEGLG